VMASGWRPAEIVVHRRVAADPVARSIRKRCPGVPVREVDGGRATDVTAASRVLAGAGRGMAERIREHLDS